MSTNDITNETGTLDSIKDAREARKAFLITRRDQILMGFRRMDVHYVEIRDELKSLGVGTWHDKHLAETLSAEEVYDQENDTSSNL
jgi:hypothetical protein